jgi:prepilin-type processing-associated H-X9-DG protein
MKPRSRIVLGWLVLIALSVSLAAQEPRAEQEKRTFKARLKKALRGQPAWTLDEAMAQLRLYPKDAYLQYVAMQLARREQRGDEIARQIEQLLGDEFRQQRNERANRVDLFSIFTGALAVQESLQLDTMRGQSARRPPPGRPPADVKGEKGGPRLKQKGKLDQRAAKPKDHVKIAALTGPTIKSHPWEKMLGDKKPEISSLARSVPEDYYLAEFRSLNKLLEAVDVNDLWGKHLFNQATQEARTQQVGERLKTQLVVETNRLLRPFYDLVVQEVAVTGSDLFVAEGSDVTLLFRFKQPEVFKARMDGFLTNVEKSRPDAKREQGEYLGIPYVHLTTPDRAVHVYSAYPAPDLHVRSNSEVAFRRVLEALQGKTADSGPVARLGDTKEFAYIRTLLPSGAKEEDGLIYLSDPFIRRLVGPQVKLTERRRMLCYNHLRMIGHAALLYRTEHGGVPGSLEMLVRSQSAPGLFGEGELACPDGGKYTLSADGMNGICSRHGHARSLTPCCEIGVDQVTGEEADEYKAFLQEYNQYWRTSFDPIALRLQMTPERYRLETIVLPLIDNSIYTGLERVLGGKPEPLDGLPVPKRNIFSVAVRLNKEALLADAGLAEAEPPDSQRQGAAAAPRRPTSKEIQCANNLKQIGLALHNFNDAYGKLPAVANFDKQGKPLLSWRVHLLPFLEQGQLYNEFHLDEPWDSEHNKKLISRLPAVYRCPSQKVEAGKTTYLAPVYEGPRGEGTMFTGRSPKTTGRAPPLGLRLPADVPDGTSNTIFIVDGAEDHAVIWTKPDDLKYDPKNPLAGLASGHGGLVPMLFADGSVHFLPGNTDPRVLDRLFIRNDGQMVTVPGEAAQPGRSPGSRFWGLPFDVEELKLQEFLSKGLGNQLGLHIYDAPQLFDFNLPAFLGMAMASFGGRQRFVGPGSELVPISFLIASLNAPVYISLPIQDAKVVDDFLNRLDRQLVELSRHGERGGFLFREIEQDFYHLPLDKEKKVRSYGFRLGPVKWRFFWARVGNALYIASKPLIVEDLLALEAAGANGAREKPTVRDSGPEAHGIIRVRARNWSQVLPDYRLAWAENNREACLHNLGPLSSIARALHAKAGGQSPDEIGRSVHRLADQTHGVHFFCPEAGHYIPSPDGKTGTCSVHGSALDPRQPAAPAENSAVTKLMREFTGMTVTLTFLEDGLHAVVTIDRK